MSCSIFCSSLWIHARSRCPRTRSGFSIKAHLVWKRHCVSKLCFLTVCSVICRYQPENSVVAYEMANTGDEHEDSNTEMLPDDRFSIKNLLCPSNTEPSPQSGSVVNICTSVLGRWKSRKTWLRLLKPYWQRRPDLSPLQASWCLPSAS